MFQHVRALRAPARVAPMKPHLGATRGARSSSRSHLCAVAADAAASERSSSGNSSGVVVDLGVLSEPRFSSLRAALDVAELTSAVVGASADAPLTVFAPTDAAFARACKERGMAFEELAGRDNLGDILKHHVVAGKVKSSDLPASGAVKALGGKELKVRVAGGAAKVDGVSVVEADFEVGSGIVVHVVDEVIFPAFSINAKVQTPQEILAFEGWAPEVINGRAAMLGFVLAVIGEISTGESFMQQATGNFGELTHTMFVWTLASLFPAFSSNEGYEANPFKMEGSKEWEFVFRGCPPWLAVKDRLSPEVEQLNGRAAMVGCASLIVLETLMGHALF